MLGDSAASPKRFNLALSIANPNFSLGERVSATATAFSILRSTLPAVIKKADALKELLKKKQHGEKIEPPKERGPSNVVNPHGRVAQERGRNPRAVLSANRSQNNTAHPKKRSAGKHKKPPVATFRLGTVSMNIAARNHCSRPMARPLHSRRNIA
jgi:hypothetical protein